MKVKPGQLIEEFEAKDGKKIIFRTPKNSDLLQLLRFINALVKEDTFILTARQKTIKEEKIYLKNVLKSMKEGKGVWLVALHKNKIIAHGSVNVDNEERSPHVGEIRLSVLKPYRNLGIGKRMLFHLIKFGKKLCFKYLLLGVMSNNKIALQLYRKFGFKQVARIPKIFIYKGKYVDDIWMIKKLR
ncbi:MAG: GNAT family N-acetyltransferase [Candidatus Aenigmarchaeota archaeon]|nr:GNAT family N-acetyltransferase [Candidatus Aenigmarchaeota archaeon]